MKSKPLEISDLFFLASNQKIKQLFPKRIIGVRSLDRMWLKNPSKMWWRNLTSTILFGRTQLGGNPLNLFPMIPKSVLPVSPLISLVPPSAWRSLGSSCFSPSRWILHRHRKDYSLPICPRHYRFSSSGMLPLVFVSFYFTYASRSAFSLRCRSLITGLFKGYC